MILSALLSAVALLGCSPKPVVPTPPLQKGEAMIHVEFKSLSTGEFNHLTEFVQALAEPHSTFVAGSTTERDIGDHNAYSGWRNDGFIDQIYQPNHPIPSPEVEASMKSALKTHLDANDIDPADVTLELRYGK